MIINDLGMLFRISKRGWTKFCKEKAAGNDSVNLRGFGGRILGTVDANITDWGREEYAEEIGMELEEK